MNKPSSTPTSPGFKEVRKYLRSSQQRETLGGFISAGWSPAELGEFARAVAADLRRQVHPSLDQSVRHASQRAPETLAHHG